MDAADDLKVFRAWAWAQSPVFGAGVDNLILDGMGMGFGSVMPTQPASTSVSDALSRLTTGLASVAASANLSIKTYYDALTSVQLMQAANRAGLSVDQYTAARTPGTVAGVASSSGIFSQIGAIPLLIAGGVVLYLIARK